MTRLEPPLFCAAFTHIFIARHRHSQQYSYRRTPIAVDFVRTKKNIVLMSGASEQAMEKAMVEQKYFIYFFRQCKKE